MSQGNTVYAVDAEHNHENNSLVFVDTTEMIPGGTAPVTALMQASPSSESATKTATKTAIDFKSKLKERFAALKNKSSS